ncbi:response regulator [candidate division KSB1 bacterium]|nr:response regulator [bacterium]NUM68368.1 response regulator [candidate division KSB1 bacterium]
MACILVVDEAANMRLLYRTELEVEGHEIVAAASAEEALKVLARRPIDAIVADLVLPDCCGLHLLSEVLTRQRHLPFIINTAYGQFRDNFQTWGAEAFVIKSSDLSELKKVLRQVVGAGAVGKRCDEPERGRQAPVAKYQMHGEPGSPALKVSSPKRFGHACILA